MDNFKVHKCVHWTRTKSCVSVLIKLTSKNVVLTPILRDGGESPGDDVTTYNTDSGDAWWSLKTAIKMSADDYCVYWETHKIAAQCARPNNRVTETSGRETSDRRGICPVHPGFSPPLRAAGLGPPRLRSSCRWTGGYSHPEPWSDTEPRGRWVPSHPWSSPTNKKYRKVPCCSVVFILCSMVIP